MSFTRTLLDNSGVKSKPAFVVWAGRCRTRGTSKDGLQLPRAGGRRVGGGEQTSAGGTVAFSVGMCRPLTCMNAVFRRRTRETGGLVEDGRTVVLESEPERCINHDGSCSMRWRSSLLEHAETLQGSGQSRMWISLTGSELEPRAVLAWKPLALSTECVSWWEIYATGR